MVKNIKNLNEFEDFAVDFIKNLKPNVSKASIVGLYGNLGAGKTTLTQNISKYLGVSERVLSPTFVIMKIYNISDLRWKRIVHIDCYRLNDVDEILKLGFEDIIKDKDNLVIIEWPEKIEDVLKDHVKVLIKQKDNFREIEVI